MNACITNNELFNIIQTYMLSYEFKKIKEAQWNVTFNFNVILVMRLRKTHNFYLSSNLHDVLVLCVYMTMAYANIFNLIINQYKGSGASVNKFRASGEGKVMIFIGLVCCCSAVRGEMVFLSPSLYALKFECAHNLKCNS